MVKPLKNKMGTWGWKINLRLVMCLTVFISVFTSAGWYDSAVVDAAVTGPNAGSTASGTNWTSPTNVYSQNAVYSSYNNTLQNNLIIRGFGITTIPTTAAIDGVTVTVWGYGSGGTATARTIRASVTTDGTNPTGTAKTLALGTTNASNTLGGATDKWGATLTPALINSANFGIVLADNDATANTLYIDYVAVTVNWTDAPANAVSATSATVATVATESTQNVVMQRLTLNSNTVSGSDNQVILSSLTLDDAGTTTLISAVKIYADETSSSSLPSTAALIGGRNRWDGASVAIPLTGGTVAKRTVTAGTPKYLYIVYDMAFGQSGRTVQSHVTNVGVSAPDTSATVSLSSTSVTLSAGSSAAVVTSCAGCHSYPPGDSTGNRNVPAGSIVGSHGSHSGNVCATCHVVPATESYADYNHRTGTIQFASAVGYTRGTSFPQGNDLTGSSLGTCTTASCHANVYGTGTVATPTWGTASGCEACHSAYPISASGPATGSHASHAGSACTSCHAAGTSATTVPSTGHADGNIDVTNGYPANVTKHAAGTYTGSCSTASCHANVYGTGTITTPVWGTASGCSACHSAYPITASGPATGSHAAHAGSSCASCHAAGTTATTVPSTGHADGDIDVTNGYPANVTKHGAGTYTGSCTTASCHANVYGTGTVTSPVWGTASGCGACHTGTGAFSGTGGGPATGGHNKHMSYAGTTCGQCHAGAVAGSSGGSAHTDGNIDVLNGYPANVAKHAAGTYSGTCSSTYCHSTGRAADMGTQRYSITPTWGGSTTCLSCHGGRNGATGAAARSTAGFTLTTSHYHHLKYAAAEMNCQICHAQTAADAATLKQYSGLVHHANNTRDVTFSGLAYGSYTAYKPTTRRCANTACHGGLSRNAWSATAINTNNTCVHCHGIAGTTSGTDRRAFAPGFRKTGTSTDQKTSSADLRVGAHFKHLSSAYMKNIKCNECHMVPSTPFEGTHMATPRFNSQTLTFAQSTTAKIAIGVVAGSKPAQLAVFTGYTAGTATKAATCSSTYCHGSRLKTGDTSGSYRKPYWNYSAMINYTDRNTACGRCHGNPPTTGSAAGTHSAYVSQPTTSCSGCHGMVVNPTGAIINKNLHINGQVNASGHEFGFAGSKHMPGGTGTIKANAAPPYTNCNGCHPVTTGGTYPPANRHVATEIVCTTCHLNSTNFNNTPGCGDCHGTNANGGQPSGAANAFPNWSGSHTAHVAQAYVCSDCHRNAGTGSIAHGNYSGILKTRANVTVAFTTAKSGPAATYAAGAMTCSTSNCHGQKSPAWGAPVPNAQCVRCHGNQSVATLSNVTSAVIAPGTGNIDTNRTTGITPRGGTHQEHLKASSNMSRKVRCQECHVSVAAVNAASHLNFTTATMTFTGVAVAGSKNPTVIRTGGLIQCNNTYCHTGNRPTGTGAGQDGINTPPVWNNGSLIGNTTLADTCINKCHALPPGAGVSGDTHQGYTDVTQITGLSNCSSQSPATGCHPTINASPTAMNNIFFDKSRHIDGNVDGGDCVSCHGAAVPSPIAAALDAAVSSRVAITPDFSLASRHIRSRTASPAVTKYDCCVCHMEGDVTTGSTTSFHKDGRINLRDPDTGLNIKGVTHSGTTSAPGAYTSTTSDAVPVRFSRNLGSASIEPDTAAIMVNLCLKCHDTNGASNAAARLVGATAGQPFGAGIAANPGSNVLDVASQFASTNRSFHPVLVRQNSGYTNTGGSRMVAPWNGVTKSASTTIYGPLITCWDCHAPNGTASTVTLTKSGVHGGSVNGTDAVPLRGSVYVNGTTTATNLCLYCHVVSGGTTNHGAGSAITSSTNSGMTYFQNRCYFCHGSYGSRASVTRPRGAGDAHGYNTRATGAAFPAVNNGYAFLRNEGWYANGYTQSIKSIGGTTYTSTCGGIGSGGGCSRSNMGSYSPGGVY